MADTFKTDCDKIIRLIGQLKTDLHRRDQKKAEGKTTGMIEAELRGSLSSLDRELEILQEMMNKYQANPREYNLLQREIERRRNVYVDYMNQRNDLKKRVENQSIQNQQQQLFNKTIDQKQTFQQQHGDKENKALYQVQKQLQSGQDEQLENINQKVINIKYIGMGINDNIKQQNKYLDQINEDIDKTQSLMNKTKNKMTKFVQQTSSCGLLVTIFLEILALILILVLL